MGEKIEDMDKEVELKDITINFLTRKTRISLEEVLEQKANLTKSLNKRDKVMKKLEKTFEKHKNINY